MKNVSAIFILLLFGNILTTKGQNLAPSEVLQTHPANEYPRYLGSVEMGFLYGKSENPWGAPPTYLASPSILLFNGYRLHKFLAIGASTGFDFYENTLITPLGLGIRGTVFSSRISPFYSMDAGFGATFLSGKGSGERPEGGWYINPALGMQVNLDNRTALIFGLGYKQQRVDREDLEWGGARIHHRITYKRLSLRMGFMF